MGRRLAPILNAAAMLLVGAHVVTIIAAYIVNREAADFGGTTLVLARMGNSIASGAMIVPFAASACLVAAFYLSNGVRVTAQAWTIIAVTGASLALGLMSVVKNGDTFETRAPIVYVCAGALIGVATLVLCSWVVRFVPPPPSPSERSAPPSPFGSPDPRAAHQPHTPFSQDPTPPERR